MKQLATLTISALILTACSSGTLPADQYVANNSTCVPLNNQQMSIGQSYVDQAGMKRQPESGDTIAEINTTHGTMKMIVYTDEVPEMAKNFTELAKEGKYEGVPFHRIIDCFMIQTGDFENQNGTGGHSYKGPGTKLEDEFHPDLRHIRGAVSMANSGPNTNGSQFFVVQADYGTPHLDDRHSVFGYIYEGLGTVDKIAQSETAPDDTPQEPIFIESIKIVEM